MRGIDGAPEADRVTSWDSIFNLAEQTTAPRVGNLKVDVSSYTFSLNFKKWLLRYVLRAFSCVEVRNVCKSLWVPQYPISFHCERQQVLTGKQVRSIPQTLKTGII